MSVELARTMTVQEYFSTQQSLYSAADATRIGPELQRLANDGATSAREIVEAARPGDAPLHPYFEWDDQLAAERFRQMQASRMVRTIVVKTVRAGQLIEQPAFSMITMQVTHPAVDRESPQVATSRAPVAIGRPRGVTPPKEVPAQPAPPVERLRSEPKPPGHKVWRDGLSHDLSAIKSDDLSKVPDEILIGQALARLAGFVTRYEGQRHRPAFETLFGPVFRAFEDACRQSGRENTTA